jgi:hypothetical protein
VGIKIQTSHFLINQFEPLEQTGINAKSTTKMYQQINNKNNFIIETTTNLIMKFVGQLLAHQQHLTIFYFLFTVKNNNKEKAPCTNNSNQYRYWV